MRFQNPLVAGSVLVRPAIESPDYVTSGGTTGWHIGEDGSAVFNDVAVRGSLTVDTDTGGSVVINEQAAAYSANAVIRLASGDPLETVPATILEWVITDLNTDAALQFSAPRITGSTGTAQLLLRNSTGAVPGDFLLTGVTKARLGILGGTTVLSINGLDVTYGAANSAGAGFRQMRVPN